MGREVGGRSTREGTCVYLWMINVDVWQKSSQYRKVIILQLKIKQNFLKIMLFQLLSPGNVFIHIYV